jgi:metallo-beta-lactamase family protein
MKISFLGAASEVTGSNILIETSKGNFLVDCGLFQGAGFAEEKNYQPFSYDPQKIQTVLLTHSHLDHCGRLPLLYKNGFRGKIYALAPTIDLTRFILLDAYHILEEEYKYENKQLLYQRADVEGVCTLFEPVEYDQTIEPFQDVKCTFYDAGHILGSAWLKIEAGDKTIVVSGDLGNPPSPLLPTWCQPDQADILILEATYGEHTHPVQDKKAMLRQAVNSVYNQKGVLLIPAFALERSQEIIYFLNELYEDSKLPPIPTYLDSPLAIDITTVFEKSQKYFQDKVEKEAEKDKIFRFSNLKFTKTVQESKAINSVPPPKVIIAGSGMLNGGRILHHAKKYLAGQNNILLIVGFQVKGTIGSQILQGAKQVKILDEDINVNCRVEYIPAFSGHADQKQLLDWTSSLQKPPEKIFLYHTEAENLLTFPSMVKSRIKGEVIIPKLGETFVV